MKKILIALLIGLPMMSVAQTTLTPEQELEQAQRQLQEAQKALEEAKIKAAKAQKQAEEKAKAEARERAKAENEAKANAIKKKIEETKAEAARLEAEARKLERQAKETETHNAAAPQAVETGKIQAANEEKAQNETNSSWIIPEKTQERKQAVSAVKEKKANKDAIYLEEGAVPEVNGQVVWSKRFEAPNQDANTIYVKALDYLNTLLQGENQLEGSQIAIVNKDEHGIVATMKEKMIFFSGFLSQDQAKFNYVLQIKCYDGSADLSISRLSYDYSFQGKDHHYTAEELITDRYSINRKRTKLYTLGKFRRGTIDRKNEIFQGFRNVLNQQ
ncbi:DUF4468 domain-containing protein [Prevotella sp. HUN102]|uniref:DUF4468 domain-containing protein n=1 Tax=Prevotella sp. HUN102 TaxID=1392486 RepID=UPI0004913F09|nr:DUF4468 domain-containing protein [Prevotella sp. HUN102]